MRTRDIQIKLWLNEEEYSVLQQDIERTGLTQSKYLRALIMKRPVREKLPIDYYHMLTELSRIGNNINQMARVMNQHECASETKSFIYNLRSAYHDITRAVNEITDLKQYKESSPHKMGGADP